MPRESIVELTNGRSNFCVVCSPNAAASHWVNEEVAIFQEFRGRDNVLLIVAPDHRSQASALVGAIQASLQTSRYPIIFQVLMKLRGETLIAMRIADE